MTRTELSYSPTDQLWTVVSFAGGNIKIGPPVMFKTKREALRYAKDIEDHMIIVQPWSGEKDREILYVGRK